MIVDYFKLQGFPFRSSAEEKQLEALTSSNPVVKEKLLKQIQLLEGTSTGSPIFQKRLEVLAKLQSNRKQLQQQLEELEASTTQLFNSLETKATTLNNNAPKLMDRPKQLKDAYEQVLDYSSNQQFKCGLKDLNEYIKLEKTLCQKIVNCLETDTPAEAKQGLNISYLHRLLQKKRIEDSLQQLSIAKLEAQIEFIEQHVIMKDSLIYNASLSRDRQVQPNLEGEIEELKKLIELDLQCQLPQLPVLQSLIQRQYSRQKIIYELLKSQTQDIADEMATVRPTEMLNGLNLPQYEQQTIFEYQARRPEQYLDPRQLVEPEELLKLTELAMQPRENGLTELQSLLESTQLLVQRRQIDLKRRT